MQHRKKVNRDHSYRLMLTEGLNPEKYATEPLCFNTFCIY